MIKLLEIFTRSVLFSETGHGRHLDCDFKTKKDDRGKSRFQDVHGILGEEKNEDEIRWVLYQKAD